MTQDELTFITDLVSIIQSNPAEKAILEILKKYTKYDNGNGIWFHNMPDNLEESFSDYLSEELEILTYNGDVGYANVDMVNTELDYLRDEIEAEYEDEELEEELDRIQCEAEDDVLYYVENGEYSTDGTVDAIDIDKIKDYFSVSDVDWETILTNSNRE